MLYKGENKWEHTHANWLDLPENLSRKMPYTSLQGHCKRQPETNQAVHLKKFFCSSSIVFEGYLQFYLFYKL